MSDASRKARELLANATPAPWQPVLADDPRGQPVPYYRGLVALIERSGERSLSVVSDGRTVTAEEWPRNAELIAAAPELLAELAGEVEALESGQAYSRGVDEGTTAILAMVSAALGDGGGTVDALSRLRKRLEPRECLSCVVLTGENEALRSGAHEQKWVEEFRPRVVEALKSTGSVPAEVHERGWQWRPIDTDTAFAPPFGTLRACQSCGCLVVGGPTECGRCVACKESKNA